MYRCDLDGKVYDTTRLVADIGARFVLVYEERGQCIIRFLVNTKNNRKAKLKLANRDLENYKYYKITEAQLEFKTVPADFQNWNLNIGSVITPLKLRFDPFNFSKDFTVGPTVGAQYTESEYSTLSWNLLFGFGISSVTLDSFNTNGYQKYSSEVVAFTPSIGIMLEIGHSQVGLFSGFDLLNSNNRGSGQYIYRGSPWISIGFGYGIFSNRQSSTAGSSSAYK